MSIVSRGAYPRLLALFAASCLSFGISANPVAFTGATIMPISGEPIENGTLLIDGKTIKAVGAKVRIPRDAETIDVSGKVILPGLVDTHSHVGETSGADRSAPLQPEARVLDSINVRNSGFKRALAGGITTINLMSGSGHLMSGQTIYVKLREGNSIEAIAYKRDDGEVDGGMKMANGTNSIRSTPFPGTRAKSAALARQLYIDAQEYQKKIELADGDPKKMPERSLAKEALLEVLDGKRIVHFHTHRHDDILTVLRLQEEFGFRVVLHHVSEAHRVANEIAAANVPVSLIMLDSPGGKLEAQYVDGRSAPILEQAGAKVALHTDDWITESRHFLRSAGLAVRAGMSRDEALRSMTINGAEILDLDDRVGTLEKGKDADFVILSGDPLSVYTRVEQTWVEGVKRFDLDDPEDLAIAEGDFGALVATGRGHIHDMGEGH